MKSDNMQFLLPIPILDGPGISWHISAIHYVIVVAQDIAHWSSSCCMDLCQLVDSTGAMVEGLTRLWVCSLRESNLMRHQRLASARWVWACTFWRPLQETHFSSMLLLSVNRCAWPCYSTLTPARPFILSLADRVVQIVALSCSTVNSLTCSMLMAPQRQLTRPSQEAPDEHLQLSGAAPREAGLTK